MKGTSPNILSPAQAAKANKAFHPEDVVIYFEG
jgi:hypothetical protein